MTRHSMATALLLLVLAASLANCTGAEDSTNDERTGGLFYVAPNGNDASAGTVEAPFATINHGIAQLEPGDTLRVREGVYHEQIALRRSGNAEEGFVTVTNEPGELAVIDGGGVEVGRGFSALVSISNVSYVRFTGFEIRNFISEQGRRNPVGIFVSGSGSDIEIADNEIHHIEATATTGQRDAHGIAVYGTSETPLTNITIRGNRVHDLKLGTSESVVINGNVDGFSVTDNEVYDNDNIGIDIIGFEGKSPDPDLDRARNGVVANNIVHGIDTLRNTSYGERNAGGIYVDGGSDVVIENNIVFDSNMGIEIASEHATGATSRIIVRNNVLFRNHIVGLAMGGYDENRGTTEGCEVTHNTLVHNDTDQTGNGELWVQFDVVDNRITNNVIVAGDQGMLMSNPYVENEKNVVDGNVWFADQPNWEWKTEWFDDWASYREATGNDGASTFINPEFRDPGANDFNVTAPGLATGVGASQDMLDLARRETAAD